MLVTKLRSSRSARSAPLCRSAAMFDPAAKWVEAQWANASEGALTER